MLGFSSLGCASSATDARSSDAESRAEPEPAASDLDASTASCGGRGEPLEGLSVNGSSGLRLSVEEFSPDPPIAGDNAWVVRLELEGEPLTGAANDLVVAPTMPDHGHGSSVEVGVTELEPGVYRLEPVNTFMVGYWQVAVTVGDGEASPSVQFGVCIE